ncbi:MAG: MarC family protein [Sulfolobaceae archaeon]
MPVIEDLTNSVVISVKLFAIMDPFAVIPYLLSVYQTYSENMQKVISWRYLVNRIMIAISILLFIFSVLGRPLLDFLGLQPIALMIGGGIVLVYIGIDTLGGFQQLRFVGRLEEAIVTPIATPLIVGPGTMTALITLSVNYSPYVLLLASFLAALYTYFVLLFAPFLVRVLGRTGTVAAGRFTAIIIAAFGVQLILDAISQIKL